MALKLTSFAKRRDQSDSSRRYTKLSSDQSIFLEQVLDRTEEGRAHGLLRPYGLTGQYWEKIGEILIDVVLGQEAVRDLPGAGQAWVIFTACLVDQVLTLKCKSIKMTSHHVTLVLQLRAGFEESRAPCQDFPKREVVLHYATKHLYETEEPDSLTVTDTNLLPTITSPKWKDKVDLSEPNCSHEQVVDEAHDCHIPREQNMIQQGRSTLSKAVEHFAHFTIELDGQIQKQLGSHSSLRERKGKCCLHIWRAVHGIYEF
ncbi:hypothetical protein TELCIR_02470 [Teladorsagia circumcincta]|uniref:Uncharacterized protein n=1 Tax=Teladorsagia circumcincta TaxID=45464 RepID=A0A2G9UYZ5_TELCI|nr:hypothetical protein TELCIR_02470 [Teladorsagia circumcincta]